MLRALVCTVYSRKPLPKRSASQGLTPSADATLVPRQAAGESKSHRILVLRAQRLGKCVSVHGSQANRGLSLREGVLAAASAVRPRAMPRP